MFRTATAIVCLAMIFFAFSAGSAQADPYRRGNCGYQGHAALYPSYGSYYAPRAVYYHSGYARSYAPVDVLYAPRAEYYNYSYPRYAYPSRSHGQFYYQGNRISIGFGY